MIMKKINSENLWEFVNNLATNQKVKFKVFYDDDYITEIFWNGNYFEWEEGTFTSEAFFNSFYDFVVIEDDDKLEKINVKTGDNCKRFIEYDDETGHHKYTIRLLDEYFSKNINKIIDHINKIEEKLDER